MTSRAALAADIVRASRSLHARGWVANHDGNVSARWTDGRFLVTPTATSKADASEGSLAVTDATGAPVEGDTKAPSEFALHLGAYAARPDVGAIVHAHPPYATALACAGTAIDVFLPEAIVSIGARVPITRFALPFGAEGAAPIVELIDRHDALLLCRHGVIAVGGDVEQAMLRMELVEHLARILTLALPHGGVRALPAEALAPLLAKRRKAAPTLGAAAARAGLDSVPSPSSDPSPAADSDPLPALPPDPNAWRPAGPPPAPDAWSGGKTEAACGVVYGAGEQPSPVGATPKRVEGDLEAAVRAEILKHLQP